jgi:hypothetical protein
MKAFISLLFCFAAAGSALAQRNVSGFGAPRPASFQQDVSGRLAARPEHAAFLRSLAIDDAGVVSSVHYWMQSEHGVSYVYQFCAKPRAENRESTLILSVRFDCADGTTIPSRIGVAINDPEPREIERLRQSAVQKKPNQPPEPTAMSVTPPAAQESRQP